MKGQAALLSLLALVVVGAGMGGYAYYTTHSTLVATRTALSEATSTLSTLERSLSESEHEKQELSGALEAEKARNDAFEEKINDISGTVGRLDKLSRTDPELLAKYSKVYFLNENYVPSALIQIPELWTYNGEEEYFHKEAWPRLEALLTAAQEDGIELRVISGYRAFEKQAQLKSAYTVRYGAGANAFSADQGYSEHQLGTAVDFTTPELGANFGAIDTTPAFTWLMDHAHRYGFILSYPKGNAYYVYEPWHWRYVGRSLAEDLDDEGKHFYDLEQRDIDEYLVDFFE